MALLDIYEWDGQFFLSGTIVPAIPEDATLSISVNSDDARLDFDCETLDCNDLGVGYTITKTISAGSTSFQIPLNITNTNVEEGDQTINLEIEQFVIGDGTGSYNIFINDGVLLLSVIDDEVPVRVKFDEATSTASNSNPPQIKILLVDQQTGEQRKTSLPTSVNMEVISNNTQGNIGSVPGVIDIAAYDTSSTLTFDVSETCTDGEEILLKLSVTNLDGCCIPGSDFHIVTLQGEGQAIVASLDPASYQFLEWANATRTLTGAFSSPLPGPATIIFNDPGDSRVSINSGQPLEVPAGSSTFQFDVTVIDSSIVNEDITVEISISDFQSSDFYPQINQQQNSVSLTIIDDDIIAYLSVDSDYEGQIITSATGAVPINYSIDRVVSEDTTISATISGNAISGVDYIVIDNKTSLPIPAYSTTVNTSISALPTAFAGRRVVINGSVIEGTLVQESDPVVGQSDDIIIFVSGSGNPIEVGFRNDASTVNESGGVTVSAVLDFASALPGGAYLDVKPEFPSLRIGDVVDYFVEEGSVSAVIEYVIDDNSTTRLDSVDNLIVSRFESALPVPTFTGKVDPTASSFTLTVIDDEHPIEAFFNPAAYQVNDGATIDLIVSSNRTHSENILINLTYTGDTGDLTASDATTTIPAGDTSAGFSLTLGASPVGEQVLITGTLDNSIQGAFRANENRAVVVFNNTATSHNLALEYTTTTVEESDSPTVEFSGTIDPAIATSALVDLYLLSATYIDDPSNPGELIIDSYGISTDPNVALSVTSLELTAGATEFQFSATITNDSDNTGIRAFLPDVSSFEVSNGVGNILLNTDLTQVNQDRPIVIVNDDDEPVTLSFTTNKNTAVISETVTDQIEMTFTLESAVTEDVVIDLSYVPDVVYTTPPYSGPASLTIPAGETTVTSSLTVSAGERVGYTGFDAPYQPSPTTTGPNNTIFKDINGITEDITLSTYGGPYTITTPGTVVENAILSATLNIQADNVTVRNCSIEIDIDQSHDWTGSDDGAGGPNYCIHSHYGYSNTLIEDCKFSIWPAYSYSVDGSGSSGAQAAACEAWTSNPANANSPWFNRRFKNKAGVGLLCSNTTARRCHFYQAGHDHIKLRSYTTIESCYFDDLGCALSPGGAVFANAHPTPCHYGDPHADFIQAENGTYTDVLVRWNFFNGTGGTGTTPGYVNSAGAILQSSTNGPSTNFTFNSNWWKGGQNFINLSPPAIGANWVFSYNKFYIDLQESLAAAQANNTYSIINGNTSNPQKYGNVAIGLNGDKPPVPLVWNINKWDSVWNGVDFTNDDDFFDNMLTPASENITLLSQIIIQTNISSGASKVIGGQANPQNKTIDVDFIAGNAGGLGTLLDYEIVDPGNTNQLVQATVPIDPVPVNALPQLAIDGVPADVFPVAYTADDKVDVVQVVGMSTSGYDYSEGVVFESLPGSSILQDSAASPTLTLSKVNLDALRLQLFIRTPQNNVEQCSTPGYRDWVVKEVIRDGSYVHEERRFTQFVRPSTGEKLLGITSFVTQRYDHDLVDVTFIISNDIYDPTLNADDWEAHIEVNGDVYFYGIRIDLPTGYGLYEGVITNAQGIIQPTDPSIQNNNRWLVEPVNVANLNANPGPTALNAPNDFYLQCIPSKRRLIRNFCIAPTDNSVVDYHTICANINALKGHATARTLERDLNDKALGYSFYAKRGFGAQRRYLVEPNDYFTWGSLSGFEAVRDRTGDWETKVRSAFASLDGGGIDVDNTGFWLWSQGFFVNVNDPKTRGWWRPYGDKDGSIGGGDFQQGTWGIENCNQLWNAANILLQHASQRQAAGILSPDGDIVTPEDLLENGIMPFKETEFRYDQIRKWPYFVKPYVNTSYQFVGNNEQAPPLSPRPGFGNHVRDWNAPANNYSNVLYNDTAGGSGWQLFSTNKIRGNNIFEAFDGDHDIRYTCFFNSLIYGCNLSYVKFLAREADASTRRIYSNYPVKSGSLSVEGVSYDRNNTGVRETDILRTIQVNLNAGGETRNGSLPESRFQLQRSEGWILLGGAEGIRVTPPSPERINQKNWSNVFFQAINSLVNPAGHLFKSDGSTNWTFLGINRYPNTRDYKGLFFLSGCSEYSGVQELLDLDDTSLSAEAMLRRGNCWAAGAANAWVDNLQLGHHQHYQSTYANLGLVSLAQASQGINPGNIANLLKGVRQACAYRTLRMWQWTDAIAKAKGHNPWTFADPERYTQNYINKVPATASITREDAVSEIMQDYIVWDLEDGQDNGTASYNYKWAGRDAYDLGNAYVLTGEQKFLDWARVGMSQVGILNGLTPSSTGDAINYYNALWSRVVQEPISEEDTTYGYHVAVAEMQHMDYDLVFDPKSPFDTLDYLSYTNIEGQCDTDEVNDSSPGEARYSNNIVADWLFSGTENAEIDTLADLVNGYVLSGFSKDSGNRFPQYRVDNHGKSYLHIDEAQSISMPNASDNSQLITALSGANAYTIELWVRSNDNTQGGPARLINHGPDVQTVSNDGPGYQKNFAICQAGNSDGRDPGAIQLRYRHTGHAGNFESLIYNQNPGPINEGLQHIVATFEASAAKIYVSTYNTAVNGGNQTGTFNPTPVAVDTFTTDSTLNNFDDSWKLILGADFPDLATTPNISRGFNGDFYRVSIFQEALVTSSIQKNYEVGPYGDSVINLDVNWVGQSRMVSEDGSQGLDTFIEYIPASLSIPAPADGYVDISAIGSDSRVSIAGDPVRISVSAGDTDFELPVTITSATGDQGDLTTSFKMVASDLSNVVLTTNSYDLTVNNVDEGGGNTGGGGTGAGGSTGSTGYGFPAVNYDNNTMSQDAYFGYFDSITTEEGTTVYFDKPYKVGRFINGEYWIAPVVDGASVNVVGIDPEPEFNDWLGGYINGAMLDMQTCESLSGALGWELVDDNGDFLSYPVIPGGLGRNSFTFYGGPNGTFEETWRHGFLGADGLARCESANFTGKYSHALNVGFPDGQNPVSITHPLTIDTLVGNGIRTLITSQSGWPIPHNEKDMIRGTYLNPGYNHLDDYYVLRRNSTGETFNIPVTVEPRFIGGYLAGTGNCWGTVPCSEFDGNGQDPNQNPTQNLWINELCGAKATNTRVYENFTILSAVPDGYTEVAPGVTNLPVPADGWFRPASVGKLEHKKLWHTSSLDLGVLNNLPLIGYRDSEFPSELSSSFVSVFNPGQETQDVYSYSYPPGSDFNSINSGRDALLMGHSFHMNAFTGQQGLSEFYPWRYGNQYGCNNMIPALAGNLSILNLDYPVEEKKFLLYSVMQAAIDLDDGFYKSGRIWYAEQGHMPGRMIPVFYKRAMLDKTFADIDSFRFADATQMIELKDQDMLDMINNGGPDDYGTMYTPASVNPQNLLKLPKNTASTGNLAGWSGWYCGNRGAETGVQVNIPTSAIGSCWFEGHGFPSIHRDDCENRIINSHNQKIVYIATTQPYFPINLFATFAANSFSSVDGGANTTLLYPLERDGKLKGFVNGIERFAHLFTLGNPLLPNNMGTYDSVNGDFNYGAKKIPLSSRLFALYLWYRGTPEWTAKYPLSYRTEYEVDQTAFGPRTTNTNKTVAQVIAEYNNNPLAASSFDAITTIFNGNVPFDISDKWTLPSSPAGSPPPTIIGTSTSSIGSFGIVLNKTNESQKMWTPDETYGKGGWVSPGEYSLSLGTFYNNLTGAEDASRKTYIEANGEQLIAKIVNNPYKSFQFLSDSLYISDDYKFSSIGSIVFGNLDGASSVTLKDGDVLHIGFSKNDQTNWRGSEGLVVHCTSGNPYHRGLPWGKADGNYNTSGWSQFRDRCWEIAPFLTADGSEYPTTLSLSDINEDYLMEANYDHSQFSSIVDKLYNTAIFYAQTYDQSATTYTASALESINNVFRFVCSNPQLGWGDWGEGISRYNWAAHGVEKLSISRTESLMKLLFMVAIFNKISSLNYDVKGFYSLMYEPLYSKLTLGQTLHEYMPNRSCYGKDNTGTSSLKDVSSISNTAGYYVSSLGIEAGASGAAGEYPAMFSKDELRTGVFAIRAGLCKLLDIPLSVDSKKTLYLPQRGTSMETAWGMTGSYWGHCFDPSGVFGAWSDNSNAYMAQAMQWLWLLGSLDETSMLRYASKNPHFHDINWQGISTVNPSDSVNSVYTMKTFMDAPEVSGTHATDVDVTLEWGAVDAPSGGGSVTYELYKIEGLKWGYEMSSVLGNQLIYTPSQAYVNDKQYGSYLADSFELVSSGISGTSTSYQLSGGSDTYHFAIKAVCTVSGEGDLSATTIQARSTYSNPVEVIATINYSQSDFYTDPDSGITWEFDAGYKVGTFLDGSPWVVIDADTSTVVINGITPSGDGIRGSMLNPVPSGTQAFDSRLSATYVSGDAVTFPLTLSTNMDSLVTMDSKDLTAFSVDYFYGGNATKVNSRGMAILTVLSEEPDASAFRPSPYGDPASKTLYHTSSLSTSCFSNFIGTSSNTADELYSSTFESLLLSGSAATTAQRLERALMKPYLWMMSGDSGEYIKPANNQPSSRVLIEKLFTDALLLSHTTARTDELVWTLAQQGIDMWGVVDNAPSSYTHDHSMSRAALLITSHILGRETSVASSVNTYYTDKIYWVDTNDPRIDYDTSDGLMFTSGIVGAGDNSYTWHYEPIGWAEDVTNSATYYEHLNPYAWGDDGDHEEYFSDEDARNINSQNITAEALAVLSLSEDQVVNLSSYAHSLAIYYGDQWSHRPFDTSTPNYELLSNAAISNGSELPTLQGYLGSDLATSFFEDHASTLFDSRIKVHGYYLLNQSYMPKKGYPRNYLPKFSDQYGGNYTITTSGVYENFKTDRPILIKASNVTIRNFSIEATRTSNCIKADFTDTSGNQYTNITIEDGWCGGSRGGAIVGNNLHIKGVTISNVEDDGIKIKDNCIVEGCYIDNTGMAGTANPVGIYSVGGKGSVIKRNYINLAYPLPTGYDATHCIWLRSTSYDLSNYTVENNWLVGATSHTIRVEQDPSTSATITGDLIVSGNRIGLATNGDAWNLTVPVEYLTNEKNHWWDPTTYSISTGEITDPDPATGTSGPA